MDGKDTMSVVFLPAYLQMNKNILLLLFTFAVIVSKLTLYEADYDLWGHLFWGTKILQGNFNWTDTYSFTAVGSKFINHEWLSEGAMAAIFNSLGESGLIIYRIILCLILFYITWKIICRYSYNLFTRCIALILAISIFGPGLSFRPQVLSYILLGTVVLGVQEEGWIFKKFGAYLLFLLFLFWTHVHGVYPVGIIVLSAALAVNYFYKKINLSQTLLIFFAAIVPTFISPYGVDQWLYVFEEATNTYARDYIPEWAAFSFQPREMSFFVGVCLSLIPIWIFRSNLFKRENLILLTITFLGITLGVTSVRHTPLFAVLGISAITLCINNLEEKFLQKSNLIKLISLATLPISILLFYRSFTIPFRIDWDSDPLPTNVVKFMKNKNIQGNVWVPLHWGSYVLYYLGDNGVKVSLDGRWTTVYPRQAKEDTINWSVYGTNGKWKKIVNQKGGDYMIVGRFNPALDEMKKDSDWHWIAEERDAILFACN